VRLRQIAAAGNSAALVLLVAVLAQAPVLFEDPPPDLPRSSSPTRPGGEAQPPAPAGARRVLLVVIDGLRDDAVAGMPRLDRLAREGGRGTARVESLIPSTVAGIRALAEGEVSPPASFLQDFGSPPAPRGGVFAAVRSAGLPTFAAGPRLWSDLYGRWLDRSVAVATVAGDDERVLRAGLAVLREGRPGLIVLHWNEPDDAAHLHGGDSPQYRRTLAWCDAALGRLLEQAGRETAVVITSDHGVTGRGGHAGPETDVVVTPLIVNGPGTRAGSLGEIRQRDVHRLLLGPLGLSLERATGSRSVSRWGAAFLLAALGAGVLLWGSLTAGTERRRAAFWLNAALWVALAVAVAGFHAAAVLIALAGLVWGSWRGSRENLVATASLVVAGGLLGLLRIADGWVAGEAGLPGAGALAGVCVTGVVLGLWLGRSLSGGALRCGLACAAAPALLARLLGETVSLSTLDVRAAFQLVDGPLGLAGAVTAAALRQALPSLSLLLGLAPSLRRCPPETCGAFAAGLAAALAGQAAAGSLLLGESPAHSLGLLVRLIGETSFLFLGSALVLGLRRRGGPPRPLAATPP
jgi:hypothetical protein